MAGIIRYKKPDGTWIELLTEAPLTGGPWARQGGAWVEGGGGAGVTPSSTATVGSSVYSILKAKGNTGGLSLDDVENVITWGAATLNTGSDVSVSGSEITIATTGTYKFTVTLRTDNGARTELFIRTYLDTGGGYVQDTDEVVSDYVARDGDQDTGAVTLLTALNLNAGDKVEFRGFGDTDNFCIMLDPGTILLVERVA